MAARTSGSGSFASLAPRLLARKGAARPAMRTGTTSDFESLANAQAALGWDDRGDGSSSVIQLRQRRSRPAPEAQTSHRAAFTLRLDSDRHLRLRLASTMKDCSAQVLVTEALDRFLDDIPQLEAMAAQCERPSGNT